MKEVPGSQNAQFNGSRGANTRLQFCVRDGQSGRSGNGQECGMAWNWVGSPDARIFKGVLRVPTLWA
jgi:hypothetical protein